MVIPVDFDEDDEVYNPRQYEDKPEFGIVLSTGDGRLLESGERAECPVADGDFIVFGKYSSTAISSLGVDFFIIRDEDIISKYVNN